MMGLVGTGLISGSWLNVTQANIYPGTKYVAAVYVKLTSTLIVANSHPSSYADTKPFKMHLLHMHVIVLI